MSTSAAAANNSGDFLDRLLQYVGGAYIGERTPAALSVTAICQVSGVWAWMAAQFKDCPPETPVVSLGLVLEHLSVLDAAYLGLHFGGGVDDLIADHKTDLADADATCMIWKALSALRDLVEELRSFADSKMNFPLWAQVMTFGDFETVFAQLRQVRFDLVTGIRPASE